mmetsp:Transcript_22005/g.54397  ORF Transcript_22005/g.54397 Transcript_22005/m.54397 type:complete len:213 (+) Transcript_22005:245-883(+)
MHPPIPSIRRVNFGLPNLQNGRSLFLRHNLRPVPNNLHPLPRDQPQRLRQRHLLLLEHPRRQLVRGISLQHRHRPLQHDRPVVVHVVRKMHRAPRNLHPELDRGGVDAGAVIALAAEGGDQGGVDVDDAAGEFGRDAVEVHPAREDDEIDVSESINAFGDIVAVMVVRVEVLAARHTRGYSMISGDVQGAGGFLTGLRKNLTSGTTQGSLLV